MSIKHPKWLREPYSAYHVMMGNIHCLTPMAEAFDRAIGILRPGAVDRAAPRDLFYHVAQCLNAHRENAEEYRRVMWQR